MTETKNEEKVEEKNYINFTDSLIEKIFDSNEDIDADNFFKDLTSKLQEGQSDLQGQIDLMIKDDELNTKKINEKKEQYIEKLDYIKNYHNNFENRVDALNQLYSDKLAYISLLSKNLFEFEKFKNNIKFANKEN